VLTFVKLIAAHFIGDFVLQPQKMVAHKTTSAGLFGHSAVHFVLYLLALLPRSPWEAVGFALLLSAIHAAIDFGKAKRFGDNPIGLLIDQTAHIVSIAVVASVLPTAPVHVWPRVVSALGSPIVYVYAGGYAAIVPGANRLVQLISKHLLKHVDPETAKHKPGIPEAGKYIGWLERTLITTFLVAGHGEIIAFLIGAKAVVRFPEMKSDDKGHFADYFLVGTMTSVGIALVGGLILLQVTKMIGHG
jgi:hypothetical protein